MASSNNSLATLQAEASADSSSNQQQQNPSCDEVDFVRVAQHNKSNNTNTSKNNNNNNYVNNSASSKKEHKDKTLKPKIFALLKSTSKDGQPKLEMAEKSLKSQLPKEGSRKSPVFGKERHSMFSFGRSKAQKLRPSLEALTQSKDNISSDAEKPAAKDEQPQQNPEQNGEPGEKLDEQQNQTPKIVCSTTLPRQHKFVKSNSISRLLNAKKVADKEERAKPSITKDTKYHTYGGRRRSHGPYLERFKQRVAKEEGDVASTEGGISGVRGSITLTTDSRDLYGGSRNELVSVEDFRGDVNEDLSAKAFRTLSRGLGKLLWKRSHSVEISSPDPEFKVSYLGNVLTGWAKGEGCVEKQLNTLWRNYTQNNKPDVIMRIKVCASGLRATTRQHGLTEYWANRITHCCAPKNYPRVFCWIYRHEGRKMKHELRCHAVLCSKEKVVQEICSTLKENLERALLEFKREKILKQNARLSLANAAYDNPSLPRRKILLSVGGNNYRPPLERSKSAPKLMAIEEAIGEEEGEEIEETNEPEMLACCQKDSLYPAMTLGRRRCRKGHSIRRTGKNRPQFEQHLQSCTHAAMAAKEEARQQQSAQLEEQRVGYGSDDSDDFEKLLKHNNYDFESSLANELLPYFDMQLHKNSSCSLGSLSELKDNSDEPLSLLPTINSDPNADPEAEFSTTLTQQEEEEEDLSAVGLRRNGVCSDGEEDYFDDDMYFRQAAILNMLHRNSMRKMAQLSLSSEESNSLDNSHLGNHQPQSSISSNASSNITTISSSSGTGNSLNSDLINSKAHNRSIAGAALDSDEGSISSGCETASTVTANQDDLSLKYRQNLTRESHCKFAQSSEHEHDFLEDSSLLHEDDSLSAEDIYQRLENRLHQSENNFSSSSSLTLKMENSPVGSLKDLQSLEALASDMSNPNGATGASNRNRRTRRQRAEPQGPIDSDSECSDESGYVEFQDKTCKPSAASINAMPVRMLQKPLLPPKPAVRKLLPPPRFLNAERPTAM